jgi:hypothetical protein
MTPESALSATKKVGVVFCRPQLLTPAVMLSSLSPREAPPGAPASLPSRFFSDESFCGPTLEPARMLVDKVPAVSRTGLDGYTSLSALPRGSVGTGGGPCIGWA